MPIFFDICTKNKSNKDFIPWPYLDTLYDYIPLLQEDIAKIPTHIRNKKIAIIGSGAAGMVAGFELLKIGLQPTIYEAEDRIGGRLYSKYFTDGESQSNVFAEMGAMRIPISHKVFHHNEAFSKHQNLSHI